MIKIKVYIDSREQDKIQKLTTYFKEHKDKYQYIESIEVKTLPSGDLCTSDNFFGCERKSQADFISSLVSGKLKQQLIELKQRYQCPLLVVEGYDGMQDCILKNIDVNPNTIIGMSTSSLSHYSVPIQYVGGFYEKFTLGLINKFYDGKQQKYQMEYTPIRRATTRDEYKLNILIGLPNTSRVRAMSLLRQFGNSIKNICNASEDDFKQIDGIGDKLAKQYKEVLE